MPITHDQDEKVTTIVRALAKEGMTDVLVLDGGAATDVLTDRRQELIQEIMDSSGASVTGLAERLDRDKSAVSRDLSVLFEYDIIDFREEGQKKIPSIKHETVIQEPII